MRAALVWITEGSLEISLVRLLYAARCAPGIAALRACRPQGMGILLYLPCPDVAQLWAPHWVLLCAGKHWAHQSDTASYSTGDKSKRWCVSATSNVMTQGVNGKQSQNHWSIESYRLEKPSKVCKPNASPPPPRPLPCPSVPPPGMVTPPQPVPVLSALWKKRFLLLCDPLKSKPRWPLLIFCKTFPHQHPPAVTFYPIPPSCFPAEHSPVVFWSQRHQSHFTGLDECTQNNAREVLRCQSMCAEVRKEPDVGLFLSPSFVSVMYVNRESPAARFQTSQQKQHKLGDNSYINIESTHAAHLWQMLCSLPSACSLKILPPQIPFSHNPSP